MFFVLGLSLIIPVFNRVEQVEESRESLGTENTNIGETGIVGITEMEWHNISFNLTYDSAPVVIATPASNNRGSGNTTTSCTNCNDGGGCNDDACDGRIPVINWVGKTGFNCTIMYDNGTDAKPPIGSEPGVYDYLTWWAINTSALTNYDWIDAGVATGFGAGLTGDASSSVSLNKQLSGDPAVFLCPQTYSQGGALPAAYWVAPSPTSSSFSVYGGVHSATDDCDQGLGHEDIGWIAIDLSECDINGFESGSESISNSAWTDISFTATEPRIIVMQNDENGAQDTKYCGARKIFSADPEISYNEQDGDGVANGHNPELVYWAVLNASSSENITAPNPIVTSVDRITPNDQTTSPLTITATSTGGNPSNVTLYYRYNSTNSSWGTDYDSIISDLDPDYWWKLDGDETDSADSADSTGGIDPDWVDPIVPGSSNTYCGDYDGDDTDIPNQGDINDGTTYDRSLSVWFIADTIDTDSNGRAIWEEGGGTNSIVLYVHEESGEDRLYFVIGESSNIDTLYCPISEGVLYHVGVWVDYSEQEMHMYLNGTEVSNNTGPFNTSTSLSSHTGTPCIGDSDGDGWDEAPVTGNFDGRIQDMMYWGDESPLLTGSDFLDMYNAGMSEPVPWVEWSDASNPDLASPWSWDFNFPNGTGYYQFYSHGMSVHQDEISKSDEEAFCSYNETAEGDWSQEKRGFFLFNNNRNYTQDSRGFFGFSNNLNYSQNNRGFFTFNNNINFSQEKKGFFLFGNNLNYSKEAKGFFTFSNDQNYSRDTTGWFRFLHNQNFTSDERGFFTFYNNLNHTQSLKGWVSFRNNLNCTREKAGWFAFSNNLNYTQSKKGWISFRNEMNFSRQKIGFFTFLNNQNYSQEKKGFFTFANNLNFSKNTRGWFRFSNNLNFTRNNKGFFTFSSDMNFTRNTAGWFTFLHNQNYSTNNRGFFTFGNNLNYTREDRGWFTFFSNLNYTRESKGWFTFLHNINFSQEKLGYFTFSNNQNFSTDKTGFFLFSNDQNFTQEKHGFFLFRNNQNYTQNTRGWFDFEAGGYWTQSKNGWFTFENEQNYTSNNRGWFTYGNNLNFSQNALGHFSFNNNMNYTRNSIGFFKFTNTTAPSFSNIDPADGETGVAIDRCVISIDINDSEGDQFNYEWACSDGSYNSASGNTNGTKFLMLCMGGLHTCETTYTWWINASSREFPSIYNNQTFSFTTEDCSAFGLNSTGWFTFRNDMNFSQELKGFFLFINNMNFSFNSSGFFLFRNNQNYTQDTIGWFTFLNDSNWTHEISAGWFNFSNISTGAWDRTQTIAWKIVNLSGTTILNLSTGGNMSIRGSLFETSVEPGNLAWNMSGYLWLTEDGDLHIAGSLVAVANPTWVIVNLTDVNILEFKDGDLEIGGIFYENV